METILHIEPIMRQVDAPLSVGHTEYIPYGDKVIVDDQDDNLGTPAGQIRLGCPLESIDCGSPPQRSVPMFKTIGYLPEADVGGGHVYLETIHLLNDQRYLIPIRSRMRSGPSAGMAFSHLPSLNYARAALTGCPLKVEDFRHEIVSNLLENDVHFQKNDRHPINEWIRDELIHHLSTSSVTSAHFDADTISWIIAKFMWEVKNTPWDYSHNHISHLARRIGVEHQNFPVTYFSRDVIARPIQDFRRNMVATNCNFKSFGRLHIEKIPNLIMNPYGFQSVLETLDSLPMTDCNIDLVVNIDNRIVYQKEHIALNRLGVFEDNPVGSFSTESLISDITDERFLRGVLEKFFKYHGTMDDDTRDMIRTQPVKIKFVKTINDEAMILLYRYNSSGKEDPLCGVYFDIALQSLAPLSIIPEPIVY